MGTLQAMQQEPGEAAVEIARSHEATSKHMETLSIARAIKKAGVSILFGKNKRENSVTTAVNNIRNTRGINAQPTAHRV